MDTLCLETANQLIRTFHDAKEYGSILQVDIPGLESADRLITEAMSADKNFELQLLQIQQQLDVTLTS